MKRYLAFLSILVLVLASVPYKADAALATNLVSYWKMDESSGNPADSVGSNTLTNLNTTAFGAAKINNGADIETSSTQGFRITDAAQSGLDFSDALTFAMWIKFESTPAGEITFIVKRVGSGNQRSYFWKMNSTTAVGFLWYTDGSTIGGNLSVSWTPSTDTWYHIAVTKSGTTVKFYVNGAQQGLDQTGSNATIHNGTAPFEIGQWIDDVGNFDGFTDEVGVWSRALTLAEISSLYNAGAGCAHPFTACESAATKSDDTLFQVLD